MTEIGGADWIERQSSRLEGIGVDPSVRMVIQQVLTDTTSTYWHVVIVDGSARVRPGVHRTPDVTLTVDVATATAITEGRTSAQREFLDGRIRIVGDIAALMAAREALAPLVRRGAT